MRAQSESATKQVRHFLGNDRVLRLNPIVPTGALALDKVDADDLIGRAGHESRTASPGVHPLLRRPHRAGVHPVLPGPEGLTVDTMEQMLSMLLDGAVETLDISPQLQQLAVDRYEEVGTWLAEHGGYRCRIYPQGSFRLGTVVRPTPRTGEYDIDLVCWLLIAKETITQAGLKQRVGDLLHAYLRWKQQQGHTDGPEDLRAAPPVLDA